MSKTQGKHIQKENVLRRAYNNTSLGVKILCVVMSFLLVALLIPLGGLKTVRSWAEENIPGVAADAETTATDTSTSTADTTATQSTDTSTSTNSATNTSTSTSTTTNSNNQLTSNSNGTHTVIDQDGNTKELTDSEYTTYMSNGTTTINFSDIGDYYIKNPTYNEPQSYYYPDVTFDMYGFKGNQGWDNYCSLQYDATTGTDVSFQGWHTRSSSESMSRGSYLVFTPNGDMTSLKIPAGAMSVKTDADGKVVDYPVLYITTNPDNPTGDYLAKYELTKLNTESTTELPYTLELTKNIAAGTPIYIFANDYDGGANYSDYLSYGGVQLQSFEVTTTSNGVIGSIAPTKTAATDAKVTVYNESGTEVGNSGNLTTSTTSSTNFVIRDITPGTNYYYKVTATGYETVTSDKFDLTSSKELDQISLTFSPLDIKGTISTKSSSTPSVEFYPLQDNDTYGDAIVGQASAPSSGTSSFDFSNVSSKIPGGATGLLYIYQSSGTTGKGYCQVYYIENLLESISGMNIDFTGTAQSFYSVTVDDLVKATNDVAIYGSTSGETKTVALPSEATIAGGTTLGISARSSSTFSQDISAITSSGTTSITTGSYTVNSDVTIKVTNPTYTWYVDNAEVTSSTSLDVDKLASLQVICNGRYSYLVDGLTKTYTEPAVATYRITASPTNNSTGSVTYTATFVTVDTSGNTLFATQTKTITLSKLSTSSHTITEQDGTTYTFKNTLTNSDLVSGHIPTTGSYYLTEDITVTSTTTIPKKGELQIDLNGHQIKMTSSSTNIFDTTAGSSSSSKSVLGIHDSQAGMSSYRHYFKEYGSSQVNRLVATDSTTDYYIDGGVITGANGAHVVNNSDYGYVTIFGGAIVGNYGGTSGAAIYSSGSGSVSVGFYSSDIHAEVTVLGKQLSTSASYCNSSYSVIFAGNYTAGPENGGASCVFSYKSHLQVTNATFYGNAQIRSTTSKNSSGGAVHARYSPNSASGTYDGISFTNVDFYNNYNSGKGGAMFIQNSMEVYYKDVNIQNNKCSYGLTGSAFGWGGGIGVNFDLNEIDKGTSPEITSVLIFDGKVNVTKNTNAAAYYKNKNSGNEVSDNISLERQSASNEQNAYIKLLSGFDGANSRAGINSLIWGSYTSTTDEGPFQSRIVDTSKATAAGQTTANLITAFTEDQVLNIHDQGNNYAIVVRSGYDSSQVSSPVKVGDFFIIKHTDYYEYETMHTETYNGYAPDGTNGQDTCKVTVQSHGTDNSFTYTLTDSSGYVDPFTPGYYYQCKYSLSPLSVSANGKSAEGVYDGKEHPITVENIYEAEDQGLLKLGSTVYYQKQSDGTYKQMSGTPVDAGTYYAKVTLKTHTYTGTTDNGYVGTEVIYSCEYTISPRPVKLYVIGEDREFNGTGYCTEMAAYMVESLTKSGSTELDPDTGLVEGESLQVTANESTGIKSKLASYGSKNASTGYTYNEYVTLDDGTRVQPVINFMTGDNAENTGYDIEGRGTTKASNYTIKEVNGEQEITPYQQNPYLVEKTVAAGVQTLELNPQTTYNWFDKGKTVPWEPTSYITHSSTSDPWLTFTPIHYLDKKEGSDNHYAALTQEEQDALGISFQPVYEPTTEAPRAGYRMTTTEGKTGDVYFEVSWTGYDGNSDNTDEYASDFSPYYDTSKAPSGTDRSQLVVIHIVDGNSPDLSLEVVSDPADGANVYAGKTINYGFKVTNNSTVSATTNPIVIKEYNNETVTNISNAKYTGTLQPGESCYIGCNGTGDDATPSGEYYYTVSKNPDETNGQVYRVFQASTAYGTGADLVSNRDSVTNPYKGEPVSLTTQNSTYDGTQKSAFPTGTDTSKFTITGNTTGTNAASYTLTATPKDGYIWSDTSTQEARTFTWTIAKRDLAVTLTDATYTYDGKAHGFTAIADTSSQLVSGQTISDGWKAVNKTSTIANTQTDVGTYQGYGVDVSSVVVKDASGNATTSNYNITTSYTSTLIINQLTIPITITANTQDSFTYNGSVRTDNNVTITVDSTYSSLGIQVNKFSPFYKDGSKLTTVNILPDTAKNVGTYTTQIESKYKTSLSYNYTSDQDAKNYIFSYTFVEKEFQITAKSINDTTETTDDSGWLVFNWDTLTYVYDGQTKSLDYEKVVAQHYRYISGTKTLVATLVVGTKAASGVDLVVTTNNSNDDAGTYQEYATGNGNYKDTTSFNWEITKRPLSLSTATNTYKYDNADHSLEATFESTGSATGLVSGSTGEINEWNITDPSDWEDGNLIHDVGHITGQPSKWTITDASGTNTTDNYKVTVTGGTLTITAADIGDDNYFTAIAGIGTYNGIEQSAFNLEAFTPNAVTGYDKTYNTTASKNAGVAAKDGTTLAKQGTVLEYDKDYEYSSGTKSATAALDSYTVTVKAKSSNYTGTRTITWTIQKAYFYFTGSASVAQTDLGSATTYAFTYDSTKGSGTGESAAYYTSISSSKNTLPTGQKFSITNSTYTCKNAPSDFSPNAVTKAIGYYCDVLQCPTAYSNGTLTGVSTTTAFSLTDGSGNDVSANYTRITPTVTQRITNSKEVIIDVSGLQRTFEYNGDTREVKTCTETSTSGETTNYNVLSSSSVNDMFSTSDHCSVTYNYNSGDNAVSISGVSASSTPYTTLKQSDGTVRTFLGATNYTPSSANNDTVTYDEKKGYCTWTLNIGDFVVTYDDVNKTFGTDPDLTKWTSGYSVTVNVAQSPKLTINPKSITISPDTNAGSSHVSTSPTTTKSKVYDRTALKFDSDEFSASSLVTYNKSQHTLAVTWNTDYAGVTNYTNGSYTTAKGSDLFTSATITGTDAEHSGSTDLTSNYNITYADGGLKVDQRDISADPTSWSGTTGEGKYKVTINSTGLTYDGTSMEPASTAYTVTGAIRYNKTDDTLSNETVTEYKITNTKQAAAGSYTATITGYGNFKGTITGTWTIVQKAITVTPDDITYKYDGNEKQPGSASAATLVSGHSLTGYTFTQSTESKWPTDVVTNFKTKVATGSVVIKDGSGNVQTSNYSISYGEGNLTIEARGITPTPDPDDEEYNYFTLSLTSPDYTGAKQQTTPTVTWYKTVDGVTTSKVLTKDTDYEWDTSSVYEAKDHNTGGNTYLAKIIGKGNFSASTGLSGTWDIKPIAATVIPYDSKQASAKSWTYDGQAHPYTSAKFTGLVANEGEGEDRYSVSFNSNNMRVAATDGTINVTATVTMLLDANGKDTPTTNYTWTSNAATIKINKVDITDEDTWKAYGGSYEYNGSAYNITASTFTSGTSSTEWNISGTLGEEKTAYTLTASDFYLDTSDTNTYTYTATDANKYDGASAYKVKIVGTGSFSGTRVVDWYITPKAATISFTSATYQYDNLSHTMDYTVSGFVDGQNVTIKRFLNENNKAVTNTLTAVGSVTITGVDLGIKLGSADVALTNYNVTVNEGTLKITAVDISNGNYTTTNAVTYYNGGQQNAFNITYTAESDSADPNKSATVTRTTGKGAGTLATTLVYGTDFTCAQADQTDAQTATALTIVGTGNYTGTLTTATYTIKKSKLSIYAYEATSYSEVEKKSTYEVTFSSDDTGSSADRQENWQSSATSTKNEIPWKAFLSVDLKTYKTDGTTLTNATGYYTDDKHTSASGRSGTAVGVVKLYKDSTEAVETTSNYEISYEYHMIIRSNEGVKVSVTTDQLTKTYDGTTSTIAFSKNTTAKAEDWGYSKTGYSGVNLAAAGIKYVGSSVNLTGTEVGTYTKTLTQGSLTAKDSSKTTWYNADFEITFTETTQSISTVELEVVSPSITINKASLTITPWTSQTEQSPTEGNTKYSTYNGTALHFDTNEYKEEGLVSGTGISQTTKNASHLATWNTNGKTGAADVNTVNSFTEENYSNPEGAKAKPRVTSVTVWGTDAANSTAKDLSSNYNITYAYGAYKMDAISDPNDISWTVTDAKNNVYDGSMKYSGLKLTATVNGKTVQLYESTDYVIASGSVTQSTQSHLTNSKYADNGYEIYLTSGSNGNYDFSQVGTVYWKVNPRDLTVTGETISVEYDGYSHSVQNATFTYDTTNTYLAKHTFTCSKFERQNASADPVDVTTTAVQYKPVLTSGCITYNGSSVNLANFNVTTKNGSVEITPCDLSQHYELTATSVNYNGYEQSPTVKVTRKATDKSCAESLMVLNGPEKEEGKTQQYTWATGTGYTNEAKDWQSGGYTCAVTGTGNFSTTGILTAAWNINRIAATVTPVSATYTYNGTAQGLVDATVTGTVASEDINHSKDTINDFVTFSNNSLTNVGSQTVTATVNKLLQADKKTETKATNYIWTVNSGTLTINPRSLAKGTDGKVGTEGTFAGTIADIVYDGKSHTITNSTFGTSTDAKNYVVGKLVSGGSDVRITGGTDFTVSGGETSKTDVNIDSEGNVTSYKVTITGQGNYTDSITVEWTINQKEVTATLTEVNVKYDGQAHSIANPKTTGLAAGQTMVPKTWKITHVEGNAITGNSRTNAGASNITIGEPTYTYNGNPVNATNYKLTCNTVELRVRPIQLDPDDPDDPSDSTHVLTLKAGSTTYNAEEQEAYSTDAPFAGNAGYSHTIPSATYTYTYTDAHGATATYEYPLVKGTDYTVNTEDEDQLTQTDAATYTYGITGMYSQQVKDGATTGVSNFDGDGEMSWTINKMPIYWWGWAWRAQKSISGNCATYDFDSKTSPRADVWWASPIGHPNGIYTGDSDLRIAGQLPEGVKFTLTTYSVDKQDNESKVAGYYIDRGYAPTVTDQAITGYVDWTEPVFTKTTSNGTTDVSKNYEIVSQIAQIIINSGETLSIDVVGKQTTDTYDGEAHSVTLKGSSAVSDNDGWTTGVGAQSSFSSSDIKLEDSEGNSYVKYNQSTNYTISQTEAGTTKGTLGNAGNTGAGTATGTIEYQGYDKTTGKSRDGYWIDWTNGGESTAANDFILDSTFDDVTVNQTALKAIGTKKTITINISNPSVTVTPRDVEVTPSHNGSSTISKDYDGTALSFANADAAFQAATYDSEGKLSSKTGLITGHTGAVTGWDSNNTLTNVYETGATVKADTEHDGYCSEKTTYPNAATATVTASSADVSKNYNFKYKSGTLHLDQASITDDAKFTIHGAEGLVYNVDTQGEFATSALKGYHYVQKVGTTTFLDYKNGADDADFVIKSGDWQATNAGDYTFTIQGQRNYKGTKTASWSIGKFGVTVKADEKTYTYDALPHTLQSSTFTFGSLASRLTGTCTTFEAVSPTTGDTQTNVGTYTYKPNTEGAVITEVNSSVPIKLSNFTLTPESNTLTIKARELSPENGFTFTATGDTYTAASQDATPTVTYTHVGSDGNTVTDTLTYGTDYEWADVAGTYVHSATDVSATNYTAQIVGKGNYAPIEGKTTSKMTATWNIIPKAVTVVPQSPATVEYDGQKHYVTEVKFNVDGTEQDTLLAGQKILSADPTSTDCAVTYQYNDGIKNVSDTYNTQDVVAVTAVNKIFASDGTTAVASRNYTFTSEKAHVTVQARHIDDPNPDPTPGAGDYVASATGLTTTYTGAEQTVTPTTKGSDGKAIVVTATLLEDGTTATLTPGTDYTITPYSGKTHVGHDGATEVDVQCTNPATDVNTYYVRIEGAGNYDGNIVAEWNIVKATLTVYINGVSATTGFIKGSDGKGVTQSANDIAGSDYGYTVSVAEDNSLSSQFDPEKLNYDTTKGELMDTTGAAVGTYTTDLDKLPSGWENYFSYEDNNIKVSPEAVAGTLTITSKTIDDPTPDDPTPDPGPVPTPDPDPDITSWISGTAGSVPYKGASYDVTDEDSVGSDNVMKIYQYYKTNVTATSYEIARTELTLGTDFEIVDDTSFSIVRATNVGTYNVSICGINNYANVKDAVVSWKITPVDVTVELQGNLGEYEYDASPHTTTGATLIASGSTPATIFNQSGVYAKATQPNATATDVVYDEEGNPAYQYSDELSKDPDTYFGYNSDNISSVKWVVTREVGTKITPRENPSTYTVTWKTKAPTYTYDKYTYTVENSEVTITDTSINHVLTDNDFVMAGNSGMDAWKEGQTGNTRTYTITFTGKGNYKGVDFYSDRSTATPTPLTADWYITKRSLNDDSVYVNLTTPLLRYNGDWQTQRITDITMDGLNQTTSETTYEQQTNLQAAIADEVNATRRIEVDSAQYEASGLTQKDAGWYPITINGTQNFYGTITRYFPILDENIPVDPNDESKALGEFKVRNQADGFTPTTVNNSEVEAFKMTADLNAIADAYDYAKNYKQSGNFYGVYMDVTDATNSIDAADKSAFEQKLASANQSLYQYLDISLNTELTLVDGDGTKTVTKDKVTKLNQSGDQLNITMAVPSAYADKVNGSASGLMNVYRIHDGVLETVDATYNASDNTVSFSADKFSSYAFAYDNNLASAATGGAQTGDKIPVALIAIIVAVLVAAAAGAGVVYYRKRNGKAAAPKAKHGDK